MPETRRSTAPRTRTRAARPDRRRRSGSLAVLAGLVGAGAGATGRALARRPRTATGATAFGVLAAVVAANALYGQAGPHPHPMVATRGDATTTTASVEAATNDRGLMPVPLVREVQTALAAAGHYEAEIDGRPGPATTAAIEAFQKTNELPVTGAATPLVLSQIRQAGAEAPNPRSRPTEVASIDDVLEGLPETGDGPREAPDAPVPGTPARDASAPAATAGEADTGSVDSTSTSTEGPTERVARIQTGLREAQVADLATDGIPGENTRQAIRTFQALEGMAVTGDPDEAVLDRLIEIGAVN